jgi:hypothetical protein
MMLPFAELLVRLAELVPARARSPRSGVELSVSAMDLTLPIESRIVHGGELRASLPRGRMSTGFDPPLAQVTVRYEVSP